MTRLSEVIAALNYQFPDHFRAENAKEIFGIVHHYAGISYTKFHSQADTVEIGDEIFQHIIAAAARRSKGVPLAYVLGAQFFYENSFLIDENVLIPRPDTERIVEKVVAYAQERPEESLKILDMGTGSGCIAISLALAIPGCTVTGLDISTAALAVALQNKERLKAKNCQFIEQDFCDPLWYKTLEHKFDFIVSNPPYICDIEYRALDSSVKKYEPRLALHGGDDGLDFYRLIAQYSHLILKQKGNIFLEIGLDMKNGVMNCFTQQGYNLVGEVIDFGGILRGLVFSAP